MNIIKIDVAVIGAGTAGMSAFRAAKAAGKEVVLVESGPYGTTCARVGCMPSKLLIAAAQAAHDARKAECFGVRVGTVKIDGKAVMARVNQERNRFVGMAVDEVEALPASSKVKGDARFVSDNVLRVGDGTEIHATSIVIATGAKSVIPDDFKVFKDRLLISDDIFHWDDLPARVAVFGAGVIGIELGQALHRLGVHVRMFGEEGRLAAFTDPAIVDSATKIFQDEFYLDTVAKVIEKRLEGQEAVVTYTSLGKREVTERFDYVLVAIGRAPNVKDLGLDRTSLKLDKKGMPLFDRRTMQAGSSSIFMAGDASNDVPLLHEAADQGKIAGNNAAHFPTVVPGLRRTPLSVVFTDPALAMIGVPHKDLEPGTFVTGEISFEDQGRSRIMLKNQGLMHVYADRSTGRLVGAEFVGPAAEHIAHLLSWAVQQQLTLAQLLEMPVYHPVVEEGVRDALKDALAQLQGGVTIP